MTAAVDYELNPHLVGVKCAYCGKEPAPISQTMKIPGQPDQHRQLCHDCANWEEDV